MKQDLIAMEAGKYGSCKKGYFNGIILWGDTEAKVREAEFTLFTTKNNKKIVLWKWGIWEDGVWGDGVWKSGTWENGIWRTGIMYDVINVNGIFETGLFFNKELNLFEKKDDIDSVYKDNFFFLDDLNIPVF